MQDLSADDSALQSHCFLSALVLVDHFSHGLVLKMKEKEYIGITIYMFLSPLRNYLINSLTPLITYLNRFSRCK